MDNTQDTFPTITGPHLPGRPNALPTLGDVLLSKIIHVNMVDGTATAELSDGTPTSDLNILGPTPKEPKA